MLIPEHQWLQCHVVNCKYVLIQMVWKFFFELFTGHRSMNTFFYLFKKVVRKLALVTLTGYMERYCPTHRSGWNWELPKFIKKIKTPDYKGIFTIIQQILGHFQLFFFCFSFLIADKRVFGVPLVLYLQRNGQTIPTAIQTAFKWLKLNALDQVRHI